MRAEYDFRNNRVVSIEMDDGRVVSTHNPRVLGAPTRWVPVEVQYPEGYDARFNGLLRSDSVEYAYDERGNKVIVTYPDADFSSAAVRQRLVEMVKSAARSELNRTDWYLVRKVETGAAVPAEVLNDRQAVRDKADAYEAQIAQLADNELNDFRFSFVTPTDEPVGQRSAPVESVPGGDGKQWVTDASAPGEQGTQMREAHADEINPLSPNATHSTVEEAVPPSEKTGLAWQRGDYPDVTDGRTTD